jgi:hypothetical protein
MRQQFPTYRQDIQSALDYFREETGDSHEQARDNAGIAMPVEYGSLVSIGGMMQVG